MKEYYFADGNEQKGPYSLEELKNNKISATTLIWREGLNDWIEAKRLKELEILFKSTPPLLKEKDEKNITSKRRKILIAKELKLVGKIVFISILIGLISSLLFFYNHEGFKYISLKSRFESSEYQSQIKKELNRLRKQEQEQERKQGIFNSSSRLSRGIYHPQLDDLKRFFGNPTILSGYPNYTNLLISSCEIKIENAIKKSIIDSLTLSIFLFIITYLVIVIKRGFIWVAENSKKDI